MEQNLQAFKHRIFRWIRHAAAVLALAAGLAGTAQAGSVVVTCDFLSFTSYIGSDRVSYVNGVALTASGTQVGASQFLSDPVNFALGVTRVDFNFSTLGNSFVYTPTPQTNISAGDIFQWGTISFTNGQWWPELDLTFRLTSHSPDDLLLDGHIFQGTLHLTTVTSPPPFDPYVEADYFFVVERPDLGSMRVFDVLRQPPGNPGNTGDFAFNGKIGSLIPTGIVALDGGGFTNPSVQPALSGDSSPEPATLTLFGIGLGLLAAGGTMRRRARARSLNT